MIQKQKGKGKRTVPAPGIEGRDDGFHDGRTAAIELVLGFEMDLESGRRALID